MAPETRILTCHCGACRLRVALAEPLSAARRCDCSFCRRRGAMTVSVRAQDLEILEGSALSLYQFGTRTAEHHFCSRCGCYTHHRRASDPRLFGVNVGGLDGVNPATLEPVPWLDGVNFHPDAARETG
jgi:hypothetical protein